MNRLSSQFLHFSILVMLLMFVLGNSITLSSVSAQNSADLYIRDTLLDIGVEPNPDTGPMWVSPDIWVRNTPDPGYRPDPFVGSTPPASWNIQPHQNPEYRSPLYGNPNYVYVLVQNRGSVESSGTERLRLYWTKASTGLTWPIHWDDYVASNGVGGTELFGAEVTEPRQNAAAATQAERDAFVQAILDAASRTHLSPGGTAVGQSYWRLQEEMHSLMSVLNNAHGTPAFLPWHREMVNRLELMLQEVDPTVNLMYWDWTTNPASAPIPGSNPPATFNYFSSSSIFMGLNDPNSIGAPFDSALGSIRRFAPNTAPPCINADDHVLDVNEYQMFRRTIEFQRAPLSSSDPQCNNNYNHNQAHIYFSRSAPSGTVATVTNASTAARDPFFFLLHTNVDRLWAQWQRDNLGRMNRATAYGLDAGNGNIIGTLTPWNGNDGVQPWTAGGGYILNKTPSSPSIVTPPIYDIAPLTIPVLQPGESVIIQIPWYPPNPADFAALGGDTGHFCLLARIETASSPQFGMTFAETNDVNNNTRQNNNIAWKNVTVVDNFPGAQQLASFLVRNVFEEEILAELQFANAEGIEGSFFDFGSIFVDLDPEFMERWRSGGESSEGIEVIDDDTLQIVTPQAALTNISLRPGEVFSIDIRFELNRDYEVVEGLVPEWDILQIGTPQDPTAVVGGMRFPIDFSRIVLIEEGDTWRYLDYGIEPESEWIFPDYDDREWLLGQAELGFGDNPVTTLDGGPLGEVQTVRHFRKSFQVDDPSFIRNLYMRLKRNDGAIVYLNGTEIYRVNVSDEGGRLADQDVTGLERDVFFLVGEIDPGLLNAGENVIAVEIYLVSPASEDMSFDLELYANAAETGVPPTVAIVSPMFGALVQVDRTIPIEVEAVDPDGEVRVVSFYIDEEIVAQDDGAPFVFEWQAAPLGVQHLRAVAVDNDGLEGTTETTISVLDNTPPSVELTVRDDDGMFMVGDPIPVSIEAFDDDDQVAFVELYLVDHMSFTSPQLVETLEGASVESELVIPDLAPGQYSIYALAYDEAGLQGQSVSVMVMIHE